jgi:hypothetical protein
MTEAAVKRARLEAVTPDDSAAPPFKLEDTLMHHEACMLFTAEKMAKKAARVSRNQDHRPRVETIVTKEDMESTHTSGYFITHGEHNFVIPLRMMLEWNKYDTGDRVVFAPIPLRKIASNVSRLQAEGMLMEGDDDGEWSPEDMKVIRDVFLSGVEAAQMCKGEKDCMK